MVYSTCVLSYLSSSFHLRICLFHIDAHNSSTSIFMMTIYNDTDIILHWYILHFLDTQFHNSFYDDHLQRHRYNSPLGHSSFSRYSVISATREITHQQHIHHLKFVINRVHHLKFVNNLMQMW